MQTFVVLHNSGRWSTIKAESAEEAACAATMESANVQVVEQLAVQVFDLKRTAVLRKADG